MPFWARKDAGAWSAPKGERAEETGYAYPSHAELIDPGEFAQSCKTTYGASRRRRTRPSDRLGMSYLGPSVRQRHRCRTRHTQRLRCPGAPPAQTRKDRDRNARRRRPLRHPPNLGPVSVHFRRTVRIPERGPHHLPPILGSVPLRRVQDYPDTAPADWLAHGGVMLRSVSARR